MALCRFIMLTSVLLCLYGIFQVQKRGGPFRKFKGHLGYLSVTKPFQVTNSIYACKTEHYDLYSVEACKKTG